MWASSPSIWWNDHEVLLHADRDHWINQRRLITVGSEEGFMVEDAKFLYAMDENHSSVVPTIMSRVFGFSNR
ncbi:hypothetical protein AB1K18_21860 [Peribacillus simplex]|uniref:hypothetical protein n=1 Tax=Peribacillus simplex TaxID=1478 RepID=UPI003B8C4456